MTFPKRIVFINSIIPLALLLSDLARNRVGPNPLEFATRTTGMLTLIFFVFDAGCHTAAQDLRY